MSYIMRQERKNFCFSINSDQIFIDIYISQQVAQAEINKYLLVN